MSVQLYVWSAAPPSGLLPVPATAGAAEDDHVAPVGQHQLEVMATQRPQRPPAVLDHPLLAHRLDRRPARPNAERPASSTSTLTRDGA